MKIAVTGTRGIPNIMGGVETHCQELFPRIAALGYEIIVMRRKSYVSESLTEYRGVQLVDIATPKRKAFEAIVHTVKAVLKAKRMRVDAVHIHAVGPALVVPLARMLGMKVIFTHHGPDYDRQKWGRVARWMLRTGERMGAKYAHGVIVISDVINTSIQKKYGRMDAHLIYNGVPEPCFIESADYVRSLGAEPQKYLFAMGRFVPEKNFHQLIAAFKSIDGNGLGYRLILAGDADFEDAYSRELKQLAANSGVILTGFIRGEKLHELLTHATAFVLPSSHEGLPISLLEAMSYGLSVAVSDIAANVAVGLPQEAYFETGNEEQLAERLRQLMNEKPQRHQYALEQYRWDGIAQQTVTAYKKLFDHK